MRDDWRINKLGDVTYLQGGSQPPKSTFLYEPKEGYIRLLQIRDFKSDDKAVYIPINKKNKVCLEKDILIGRYGASVGKVCTGKAGAYNVALMKATPFDDIFIRKYYLYYLKSDLFQKDLINVSSRGAQNGFNKDGIYDFEIPTPSIEEQKEIVSILDDAFASIDKAKANIERNIENAKELFQSKLNEIFSQTGEGWEIKRLNDICEVKDGTHDSPKYVDEKDGVPFVTQKNILDNGLSFEKTKFISQEDHNHFYKRSNVAYNDILFSMIGANRGMACIVDENRIFSIKNVGLIKSNNDFLSKYILYFLKSPIAKKYVSENSSGSAQGFIALGKLRAFTVPFINLAKQKEIVSLLVTLDRLTKSTVFNYKKELENLEELKKSILQKAFSGELTNKSVAA